MREKLADLETLVTEQQNPNSRNIDTKSTAEILQIINSEDQYIPRAVKKELDNISRVVDRVVEVFKRNGRLFYVGAGTDPEMVQGIIAGGNEALIKTVEWIEDKEEYGEKVIVEKGITNKDIVIGISASGYAPFVMGAMRKAKETGSDVVFISCNISGKPVPYADMVIALDVGPEIIAGSTRMKSGTAQKMVLNMITTASMIKLGKVYNNLMVDLKPVNSKLVQRSVNIIKFATGCSRETAEEVFEESGKRPKTAILMILLNVNRSKAETLLENSSGVISLAVGNYREQTGK